MTTRDDDVAGACADAPEAHTADAVEAPDLTPESTGDGGDAAAVDRAFDVMAAYAPEDAAALRQRWGPDGGANLRFARAFATAHPELVGVVMNAGLGDDPAVIEMAAMLGRRDAETAGDPDTIPPATAPRRLSAHAKQTLEDRIDDLHEAYNDARARGNDRKAQKIDSELSGFYRQLYGTQPVVGAKGRGA